MRDGKLKFWLATAGIKLLSAKEVAVTKAYTIGRRGSFKDYIDLYFILKKKISSPEEIIKMAEKKV